MLKIVKEEIITILGDAVGLTVMNVCTIMDLLRWIVIYPLNQEVDRNYFTDKAFNIMNQIDEES